MWVWDDLSVCGLGSEGRMRREWRGDGEKERRENKVKNKKKRRKKEEKERREMEESEREGGKGEGKGGTGRDKSCVWNAYAEHTGETVTVLYIIPIAFQ